MDISLVIPLLNESESLPELHDWIRRVLEKERLNYEIIFIDDGSSDDSWAVINELARQNPAVRGISFTRNYGKSAALATGFQHVRGQVVVTMDADLQDSPDELPELYRLIAEEKYHIVSGWKKRRYDNVLFKNIPSKLYNAVTRAISGIPLHDFNCGLKSYDRRVVQSLYLYGEMHRYIPLLAKWNGFSKITEKVVVHQPRKYGVSKFGLERFLNGFLDLMSVTLLTRFRKKPMHLFGTMGIIKFFIGFVFAVWLIIEKQWAIYHRQPYREIVDQPLFFLSLIALVVGVQLFLAGFIAELIVHTKQENTYNVAQTVNINNQ
ncbi:MAG: glycosyltransferase family 2 protein [Bernardetiaceae bacterium]